MQTDIVMVCEQLQVSNFETVDNVLPHFSMHNLNGSCHDLVQMLTLAQNTFARVEEVVLQR